jgi:hypothetical protein
VSRVASVEISIVAVCLFAVALSAAALVHLNRTGPEAFARARVNRGAWIGLLLFGAVLPLPGIVFPLAYLAGVRGKLTSR